MYLFFRLLINVDIYCSKFLLFFFATCGSWSSGCVTSVYIPCEVTASALIRILYLGLCFTLLPTFINQYHYLQSTVHIRFTYPIIFVYWSATDVLLSPYWMTFCLTACFLVGYVTATATACFPSGQCITTRSCILHGHEAEIYRDIYNLDREFNGFLWPLQENVETVVKIGHDCFSPHHLQFFIN